MLVGELEDAEGLDEAEGVHHYEVVNDNLEPGLRGGVDGVVAASSGCDAITRGAGCGSFVENFWLTCLGWIVCFI